MYLLPQAMEKPPVQPRRSLSTSTLDDHETASPCQFLSVTSAIGSHLSMAVVQSPESSQNDKAYPIPARRTQKFRSKSSDSLNSIEEYQSLPASMRAPVPVLKIPLGQQYSNPELSRRIKPPRPPPPVRQVPPRTYTKLDAHLTKGKSDNSVGLRTPTVIDTRARRQRHSELPLPKRPPLPYETIVPQHQGSGTDVDGDACVGSETNKLQETRIVVATPADYEVAIPAATKGSKSSVNMLTSGIKPKLPPQGNEPENEPDVHMYAEISNSIEEGVGCEPLYIEMNPTVYISPPKDYKAKKRSAKVDIKR